MTITAETSSVPRFVAELVRAANEVDRLTAGETESLLLRAMTTVRDLREQAGIPGSGTEHDAIVRLELVATSVGTNSQEKSQPHFSKPLTWSELCGLSSTAGQ
jgi:hypothetical protein